MTLSFGVNTTLCVSTPAFGAVDGVAKANVPETLAVPLLREAAASVWPNVSVEAVGFLDIVGVAFAITKSRLFVPM